MAWKLIYTSAPRLLQAGRSGFGTVARHREISPLVAETAEKSSQFSRQTGLDSTRGIFAYRLARSSAGTFHLLTHISDAGTDYSGRTNHLAEHLILSDQEVARLGSEGYTPAGVMLAYEWAGYQGQARWLGDEDLWQPSAVDANTGGSHWQAATTEPSRVRLLASAETQSGAVLEYPSHYQSESYPWILWLFAESQSLCPQSGWGITFTTNLQPTDSLSDFRWLAVPDNSPLLQQLRGSGRPFFTFSSPVPLASAPSGEPEQPALPLATPAAVVRASEASAPVEIVAARKPPPQKTVAAAKTDSNRWPMIVYIVLSPLALISIGFLFYGLGRNGDRTPSIAQEKSKDANALTAKLLPDVQLTLPSAVQSSSPTPSVTSIPQEKAVQGVETEPKRSTEEEMVAAESKQIGAKKTTEPTATAPASSLSEQKPTSPAPPRVRPSSTLVLFPSDSWEQLNWPDSWSFEDLQITVISQSGKKQILKAPTKANILTTGDKFYHTESGDKVFRASGKHNRYLPNERLKKDAHVFDVSSTKTPDDVWRIYVLPDDKSLQSVVPADDFLMLNRLVVSAREESSSLRLDTTELVLAEFFSYLRNQASQDAGSPSLVLEASYPEPQSMQSARGEKMIDKSTAESINRLRIPLDDKGQLILEEAKKPFTALNGRMEQFRSSSKPSDLLSKIRGSLLESLRKIAKGLDSYKDSDGVQSLFPDEKLSEIPQNIKSEDMPSQLGTLTDQYFDGLEFLLPKGNNTKLQQHRKQSLEHIQNKKYLEAGKSATLFIEEKRQVSGQNSLALRHESKALEVVLNFFVQRSSNAVTEHQRELAGKIIEELPQSLPHLFYVPPQVPDLSYTLKIRRGAAAGKHEHIITDNIPVKRTEVSKLNPTP